MTSASDEGKAAPSSPKESRIARRLGRGDLGFLPVILALAVIGLLFQVTNDTFVTARNLSNLSLQLGALGIMTLGLVPVLLIGEIDLSTGSVSGLCASVMAVLSAYFEQPAAAAIAAAVTLGAVIGLVQGLWIVVVQAPSLIVTLTGLLVWQGAQHLMLGYQAGELKIEDPFIQGISSTYMPVWLAAAIVIVVAGAAALSFIRSRRKHGQLRANFVQWGTAAAYPVAAATVVLVLQRYFGVPYLLLLLVVLTVALTVLTERTPFGIHVYAVGGNAEAARRAGVNVAAVRIAVFAMCSTLAALAGVVSA